MKFTPSKLLLLVAVVLLILATFSVTLGRVQVVPLALAFGFTSFLVAP